MAVKNSNFYYKKQKGLSFHAFQTVKQACLEEGVPGYPFRNSDPRKDATPKEQLVFISITQTFKK